MKMVSGIDTVMIMYWYVLTFFLVKPFLFIYIIVIIN
jgi:hypothetical protein